MLRTWEQLKRFKYFLITGLIPIILAKEWNWRGRHRFWPKKPIKVVNISILYIIRNFYIFQTIFGYEQEVYFCPLNLAASFTFEQLMVGNYHDHETSAHTVNCMHLTTTATRTTKRTLTTTVLYMDMKTIKITSNIFSFLVDQLVNIPIVLAQKQWLKLISLALCE